jgi:biopolymer transport protein ExbB
VDIFSGGTLELLKQGGFTLVAIILMSVLALGVALERYLTTRVHRQRLALATQRILGHLREPNPTMASAVNQSLPWHPGQPLFQLLLDAGAKRGPGEVRRAQARVIRLTRRRLWVLATIGATAPFVGLFGTVLGIMEAFRQIAAEHTGGFDVVSAGISEALVTTAGGIFVGVEAVVFFNFLQVIVGELAAEIKESAEEILETVQATHGDSGPAAG